MTVVKFISTSERIAQQAQSYGWWAGARYTNLRDVRWCRRVGFLDIDWRNYDFNRHLAAAERVRPVVTVARDVTDYRQLDKVLFEAEKLARFAEIVMIVPKDVRLGPRLREKIGPDHILGFSVPSKYGETLIKPEHFDGPVHLLGGRPDLQRNLANYMSVISIDCNRFTVDAKYGWVFQGDGFRRLGNIGYDACILLSIDAINELWRSYRHPVQKTCESVNRLRAKLRAALRVEQMPISVPATKKQRHPRDRGRDG